MDKLLTVLVPAFNVASYLDRALSSCLVTNIDMLEVLIVNDGSTDNTVSIAESFAKKYPDCFKAINKINGGYGSVLNYGVANATGKYFKVLDGDDWFNPESLSMALEDCSRFDSELLAFDYLEVEDETAATKYVSDFSGIAAGDYFVDDVLTRTASMHSFIFKTELIRECGIVFPERCLYTDTILATMLLDVAKNVKYKPIDLYQYRVGRIGQSIDPSVRARKLDDMNRVLEYLIQNLKSSVSYDHFAWRQCISKFDTQYKEIYKLNSGNKDQIHRLNYIARQNKDFREMLAHFSRVANLSLWGDGLLSPFLVTLKGLM